MQAIQDALSPERLAQFRKMFNHPETEKTFEQRASELDTRLCAQHDARAEALERCQYEERKVAKVEARA